MTNLYTMGKICRLNNRTSNVGVMPIIILPNWWALSYNANF